MPRRLARTSAGQMQRLYNGDSQIIYQSAILCKGGKMLYEVWYQHTRTHKLSFILVKASSFVEARERAKRRIKSPIVDCRRHE